MAQFAAARKAVEPVMKIVSAEADPIARAARAATSMVFFILLGLGLVDLD